MPKFKMYPLRVNNILPLYAAREQINLDPPYQRLAIWDPYKKQCFIDSVINGFDVPKLYFHQLSSPSRQKDKYNYAVIDGKQRIVALWEFMSNSLPLADDFVFFEDESIKAAGAKYQDLMADFPRLRARFDSFDIPITIVESDDTNFIEDLFARLNIQMPLTAPERRNALGGPLPYMIRKIGVHDLFIKKSMITNYRLQHFDLAAKFIYLMRANAIESTKRMALDELVITYRKYRNSNNEEASQKRLDALESKTREVLDDMAAFFDSEDWLLSGQGKRTLYFHIFRICHNKKLPIPFTRKTLGQFNDELTNARKKSQRAASGVKENITDIEQTLIYFDREKQSPNDAGAMKRQYDYMSKYFAAAFKVKLPSHDG